ncbi:hypothetical protein TU82_19505 [Pseudomonas orientalis]|nr:hypothetical protein TU82_19505 [Pseudomonas orientalis]
MFGWQGNLGVSLIDPRDRDSGHTLARRARRTLNLDLDRQFDKLGVGASWQGSAAVTMTKPIVIAWAGMPCWGCAAVGH